MKLPFSLGAHPFFPGTCLKAAGEDSLSFLQGQFTQDLRPCEKGQVVYGLWLDQKGRVLADSFVLKAPHGNWFLGSYFCPVEIVQSRLERYLIADDVATEDVTASWSGIALVGPGVSAALGAVGALPPENGYSVYEGGFIFRGRRSREAAWDWFGPRERRSLVEAKLPTAAALPSAVLERLRITDCIPAVPTDVGPKDLPNEAGLEDEAISYTKGCYLGQEVMARLKSMGKVRRRLIKVRGHGAVPASLPVDLYAAGKKVGELRSAISDGDDQNEFIGLAMISLLMFDAAVPLTVGSTAQTVQAI